MSTDLLLVIDVNKASSPFLEICSNTSYSLVASNLESRIDNNSNQKVYNPCGHTPQSCIVRVLKVIPPSHLVFVLGWTSFCHPDSFLGSIRIDQ